jgi:uncharacterized membrane protein
MEEVIYNLTEKLIFGISIISVVLITVGVLRSLYTLVIKAIVSRQADSYAQTRLELSRYLLLALEFQIAADILETVLKPGWEEFGQLAATIAIRSVLSYILILETKSSTT